MREFRASVSLVMCTIAALLALGPAVRLLPRSGSVFKRWSDDVSLILHREANFDIFASPDGYYERLIDGSTAAPSSRVVSIVEGKTLGLLGLERKILHYRSDYLSWGFRSNLKIQTPDGLFITNSLGLADVEHPITKPRGTRRIVLLGDSFSRAYGVAADQTYGALLQRRLNERPGPAGAIRFEMLDFAVDGYITSQFPAMAEEARAFTPDLYLLGLTIRDEGGAYGFHMFRLMSQGLDLRYPLLRKLVKQSGASAADTEEVVSAKLAPYWDPITKWAFSELRTAAAPASVLVILLPSLDPEAEFTRTRRLLIELAIPFVDISECFAGIADLDALGVSPRDTHLNARGHRLTFDCLYLRLTHDPVLWRLVSGQGVREH